MSNDFVVFDNYTINRNNVEYVSPLEILFNNKLFKKELHKYYCFIYFISGRKIKLYFDNKSEYEYFQRSLVHGHSNYPCRKEKDGSKAGSTVYDGRAIQRKSNTTSG